MTKFSSAMDRDANRQVFGSGLPFLSTKSRTYTGASGLGAQGATTIFTVTGDVEVKIFAICATDLASTAGTVEVGISGNTASLIAQTTATAIDQDEVWLDATPATAKALALGTVNVIGNGADIIETIATANVTGGALTYYCFWRPLSASASIVAA
jgi:hypothetical protein